MPITRRVVPGLAKGKRGRTPNYDDSCCSPFLISDSLNVLGSVVILFKVLECESRILCFIFDL